MTKITHISSYIILILFLQCNGSGGGACLFFKPDTKQREIVEIVNESPEIKNIVDEKATSENKASLKKNLIKSKPKKTLPKATYVQFTNAPETITPITPAYPKYELENGVEGVVYIQFRIDTLGNVAESYIAKSSKNKNLDNAALNAVSNSKWDPAENQGKRVSVWQTLPFEFKLSQ